EKPSHGPPSKILGGPCPPRLLRGSYNTRRCRTSDSGHIERREVSSSNDEEGVRPRSRATAELSRKCRLAALWRTRRTVCRTKRCRAKRREAPQRPGVRDSSHWCGHVDVSCKCPAASVPRALPSPSQFRAFQRKAQREDHVLMRTAL